MRYFVSLVVLLMLPSSAFAWWNDKWTNRLPVVLSQPKATTPASASETQVVSVKLHAGNFPDFFSLQENLNDLRFIGSDDKTPLKFHVESFDLVNQLLMVWVQVPSISADKPATIYMYYGNAEAVSGQDIAGTFDVNHAAQYHFLTATPGTDSTANNNLATLSKIEIVKASLIGSGLKFAGEGQLSLPDSPSLIMSATAGFSISFWIKPTDDDAKNYSLYSRSDAKGNSLNLLASSSSITVNLSAGGKNYHLVALKGLEVSKWQHLAISVDKNSIKLFLNAEELKSESIEAFELGGVSNFGQSTASVSGFVGELDELGFTKAALTAQTISIAVHNQGMVDEVVAVKAPEEKGSGEKSSGLFDVILKSTDTLGWILMGVMGLMALICWIVMFGKALYLRQVQKDNKAFMAQYATMVTQDPAGLDKPEDEDDWQATESPIAQAIFGKHDHFQSSTLYHLYHKGISEIKARSAVIQKEGLSGRSINAIRATLDSQMVREAQRLQSKMILLTICISGGPFIGLFGTVMGVMITFAAIAATGDVNIAAIAPGVAAALLTTLGGLGVAIPALFGYNYLSSRIKESIADMKVFGDEFSTRLAEYYGRTK